MNEIETLLETPPLRDALRPLVRTPGTCYLVGGALRDSLLGRPVRDFDFATPDDPTALAKAFAVRTSGRWFMLDQGRRQSRVVLRPRDPSSITVDFAPFRAEDLAGDLRLRDFTVNALACDVLSGVLQDPFGGRRDLDHRQLRQCSERTFRDDPLRILRTVRLAQTLAFDIEAGTWDAARRASALLLPAPAERIGDEMVQIFDSSGCEKSCRRLAALGGLSCWLRIPSWSETAQGAFHKHLEGLERLADDLAGHSPAMAGLMSEPVGRGLHRLGRLRLASLLRAGKAGATADMLENHLALGKANAGCVVALAAAPVPEDDFLGAVADTPRARALWADRREWPVDRLLFQAVLVTDPVVREGLLTVLRSYLEIGCDGRIPDLVDGRRLAETTGIRPGPKIGKILKLLREAEIRGRIRTPEDVSGFLAASGEKSVDNENGGDL